MRNNAKWTEYTANTGDKNDRTKIECWTLFKQNERVLLRNCAIIIIDVKFYALRVQFRHLKRK